MIIENKIKIDSINGFYDEFELTEKELKFLVDMAAEGLEQDAVDFFVNQYIVRPGTKYQDIVTKYLVDADSGPIPLSDTNKIVRHVSWLSFGLITLLSSSFVKFVKNIYAPTMFNNIGLRNLDVKKAIIAEVNSKYKEIINTVLSQTQTSVNTGVRTLQREIIFKNVELIKNKVSGKQLNEEVALFRNQLKIKYPDIYKAIEKGNILVVRKLDGDKIRHYKIDYYLDMVTRTTILNADRNAVEITALANKERVVDYLLADIRIVKKPRDICESILKNLVLGKSILALDNDTAKALGIMTVEEARSTPDFAMGVLCRHTIGRCSKEYLEKIDKLLEGSI